MKKINFLSCQCTEATHNKCALTPPHRFKIKKSESQWVSLEKHNYNLVDISHISVLVSKPPLNNSNNKFCPLWKTELILSGIGLGISLAKDTYMAAREHNMLLLLQISPGLLRYWFYEPVTSSLWVLLLSALYLPGWCLATPWLDSNREKHACQR